MKKKVAVVGAGTMGAAIAGVFVKHEYDVAIYSRSDATLEAAKGVVTCIAGPDASVTYTTSLERCVAGAVIVSESVAENAAVKQKLFADIEQWVDADCLLSSNTSSVSITDIARHLARPERVIGLHWFNPPDIMPLIEIISGAATSGDAIQRARDICAELGKEVIEVKQDIAGFVVNRLQYAILREALYLVESGVASIADVDLAVESTLAPRWSAFGPLKLMDLAGLDVVERVSDILMPALSRDTGTSALVRRLCSEQALGIKTERGFYEWTTDSIRSALQRRDETVRMLVEHRARASECARIDGQAAEEGMTRARM
ncbi:3-hydroxyacyl-CoA dehydrogenase family protein [Burkholderia diffusa]|uniref:3-hydroxyacyl-CoA dehydrogenase family protein n=1 Tax=Burkholderia diffusa TaxID=488732 RepID=UPI00157A5054|nr:3-hydroxyacyl-CoA dehydrogenase family protein [Burkholderia diffusa]NTY41594.1 3-hydroxyacyl-CoA dehydrogenase family protein [Burkholderia diffusa]